MQNCRLLESEESKNKKNFGAKKKQHPLAYNNHIRNKSLFDQDSSRFSWKIFDMNRGDHENQSFTIPVTGNNDTVIKKTKIKVTRN